MARVYGEREDLEYLRKIVQNYTERWLTIGGYMEVIKSRIELLKDYLSSLEELKLRKEKFHGSLVYSMAVE